MKKIITILVFSDSTVKWWERTKPRHLHAPTLSFSFWNLFIIGLDVGLVVREAVSQSARWIYLCCRSCGGPARPLWQTLQQVNHRSHSAEYQSSNCYIYWYTCNRGVDRVCESNQEIIQLQAIISAWHEEQWRNLEFLPSTLFVSPTQYLAEW